ncbi:hypothetical protein [Kitasatospora griseola]|uniref:hypothetical protein n=1 Tax=Kitasatospora griseola TaxID=2064 RepID=UPI00128E0FED|nr:hypothetical protein [Kitasatospora griseola]
MGGISSSGRNITFPSAVTGANAPSSNSAVSVASGAGSCRSARLSRSSARRVFGGSVMRRSTGSGQRVSVVGGMIMCHAL